MTNGTTTSVRGPKTAEGRKLNELALEARRLAEEVINLERTLEFDPPSEATELRLAQIRLRRLRRQADQALDALRDQARGILRKEAGKFTPHKKGSRSGELAADYASAAEEGFLIAHRTWDPSKGSFSTWLVMKLKKALQKEVARLERGGVSLHTFYAEAAVRAVEREAAEAGEGLTDAEICARAQVTPETLATIRMANTPSASLNAPAGDDEGGAELGDLIVDEVPDLSEEARRTEVLSDSRREAYLLLMLSVAPDRISRFAAIRRLGLDGEAPQTLDEVGTLVGMSSEPVRTRVRHIENVISEALTALTGSESPDDDNGDVGAALFQLLLFEMPDAEPSEVPTKSGTRTRRRRGPLPEQDVLFEFETETVS